MASGPSRLWTKAGSTASIRQEAKDELFWPIVLAAIGAHTPSAAAHGTCADHSTQVRAGEFGWSSSHDRDSDGIGCESNPGHSSSSASRTSDATSAGGGGSVDLQLGLLLLGGVGYGGYRIGQKWRAN